mmetsp:Transcript_1243/g.1459  ORF Transcript_1243/g.1459 Transcript_1243/m.1459 type:complete len:255 (-) Transcript_1243:100-864(-)
MSTYKQSVSTPRKGTTVPSQENVVAVSTSMGIKLPPPPKMSKEEMLSLVAKRDAKATSTKKEKQTQGSSQSTVAASKGTYAQSVSVPRKSASASASETVSSSGSEAVSASASNSMGIKLPKAPTQAEVVEWQKQNRKGTRDESLVANEESVKSKAKVSNRNENSALRAASLPKISSRYGSKPQTKQAPHSKDTIKSSSEAHQVPKPHVNEVMSTVSNAASEIVSAFSPGGSVGVNIHINAPIEIHIHNGKRSKL